MDETSEDIDAMREARDALVRSSSRQALLAAMNFLWDYFVDHPSKELPEYLRDDRGES